MSPAGSAGAAERGQSSGPLLPTQTGLVSHAPTWPEAGKIWLSTELFDLLCGNATEGASGLSILKMPRGGRIRPGVAVGRG